MYSYIKGTVENINSNSIDLECNGIGYNIYVANPYFYKEQVEYKVFLYQQIREDENTLYGFSNEEEKSLFLKLISVKGIGPKLALPMFATGSISGIVDAIERENILYLTKFPKVGDKVARQIILDLKGKLGEYGNNDNNTSYEELVDVLKGLGYKEKDFKYILNKVDVSLSIENQIKEALKLLLK